MDVPRNIAECTCFICVKQKGRIRPKASAFFVSVPVDQSDVTGGHVYLVTAKHCVEKAKSLGSMFVRLNAKSGFLCEEVKTEWIYPEEEGPDVAVLSFSLSDQAEIRTVPIGMMATDQQLTAHRIGVGDDVAVTGLFTKIPGTSRNQPILRGGMNLPCQESP